MAQASKAEEPSMEEILASIRRIISDEDTQNADAGESSASDADETAVTEGAADDMGDASEMSQDDLDKLFDMDGDDDDLTTEDDLPEDEDADDMAAAMAADAAEDDGDEEDVLELTEELAVTEDDAIDMVDGLPHDLDELDSDISFAPEPEADLVFEAEPDPVLSSEPAPAPIPASTMETTPIPDVLPGVGAEGPLTSSDTGASVNAAFDNLANMFVGSQAQTVEELVKEMLRPMLKAWLDQNLPGMVEQMVQKEIQRVTRGRP